MRVVKRGWAGNCRSRALTATVTPRPQWQPWCTWALSDTANRRGKHSGGFLVPHSHADPVWVVVTAKVHTVARRRGRQFWVTTPANLRTTACSAPLLTAATHAECVAADNGCVRVRGRQASVCMGKPHFHSSSWWQWCLPWHNPAKLYVHVFSAVCSPAYKQWNSSATSLECAVVSLSIFLEL